MSSNINNEKDRAKEWLLVSKYIRAEIGEEKYKLALSKRDEIGQHLVVALDLQNILSFARFREVILINSKNKQLKLIKADISNISIERSNNKVFFNYTEDGETIKDVKPCWMPSFKDSKNFQAVFLYDEYHMLLKSVEKNQNLPLSIIKKNKNKIKFTFKDIVQKAFEEKASDIHITYNGIYYYVFFRIEGDLIPKTEFIMSSTDGLEFVKQVKIIASRYVKGEFNADQHFKAQDAKIEYKDVGLYGIDIRLEFIPDGKLGDIALIARILERKQLSKADLKSIGYENDIINAVERASKKRNGLFIASGITGSGKSTLIANILLTIDKKKRIFTIEDPIEYQLNSENISQHQIYVPPHEDKKMGFLEYVKALKRADPDIVNIGEMRNNPELVKAIMEMSASGQLVFTTLHITSAFGLYEELQQIFDVDINITRSLILFSINQVLVKKLCPKCKIEDTENFTINKLRFVENDLQYLYKEPLEELYKDYQDYTFFVKGRGCRSCNYTGYSGRTPIYEYFAPDVAFKEWLAKNKENITPNQVEQQACMAGLGKNKLEIFINRLKEGIIDASDETLFKI